MLAAKLKQLAASAVLNIVFSDESDDAVLKLIDFDASVTRPDLDTGDMLRGPAGTLSYMSPEMFNSVEDMGTWYDTKTDLFVHWCYPIKMLSGKEPFTAPGFTLACRDVSVGGDLDFLEEGCVKDIRDSKYISMARSRPPLLHQQRPD